MKEKLPANIYHTKACHNLIDKASIPFQVTHEKCQLTTPRPWCSHDIGMELVLYVSGKGVLHTPMGKNPMHRGSVCLIPPNVQTKHIPLPDNQIIYWNFLFLEEKLRLGDVYLPDLKKYQELCQFQDKGGNSILPVFCLDAALTNEIDSMASELHAAQIFKYPDWKAFCSSAFLYLLVRIICECKKDRKDFSSVENRIEQIANYIERNCSQPLFLDMLAQKAGMSQSSLSHHFKEEKNISPGEYLIRCRLRKAISMFDYCDDISHIANECGFCEQSYFSRIFNRYLGLTPSQFRQSSIESQRQISEKLE